MAPRPWQRTSPRNGRVGHHEGTSHVIESSQGGSDAVEPARVAAQDSCRGGFCFGSSEESLAYHLIEHFAQRPQRAAIQ